VAVEYTLLVVLHILQVDRSDKGTGYAAGSHHRPRIIGSMQMGTCDGLGVLALCGDGLIHSPGCTAHTPG